MFNLLWFVLWWFGIGSLSMLIFNWITRPKGTFKVSDLVYGGCKYAMCGPFITLMLLIELIFRASGRIARLAKRIGNITICTR